MIKKSISIVMVMLLLLVSFIGCNKEVSQEEVEASEYYIALQKKYNTLKKKNDKLNEQLAAANEKSPEEVEIDEFFASISRNSLIKVEIAYAGQDTDSYMSESAGVISTAVDFTNYADLITGITIDKMKLENDLLYRYYFYDEDNTTHEINVYEQNYVVFYDLPDKVFYVPNATDLGDGFLKPLDYTPEKGFFATMAESSILLYKDKVLSKKNIRKTVEYLDTMEKTKVKQKNVKTKMSKTYEFYSGGELIELSIGSNAIHLKGNDKDMWYKISKESSQELLAIVDAK